MYCISQLVWGGDDRMSNIDSRTEPLESTSDTFIEKVSALGTGEGAALLYAGTVPMSLLEVLKIRGTPIDDPATAQVVASAYGVPPGDREALVQLVRDIVWLPPYRPAPFVGHIGRPFFGDDLHINVAGFRDRRQTYLVKPERTVRIFITGGSMAWGVGASSQKLTISHLLEQILNERVSRITGYRYEVVNAAFPAWSTTQEKLLIQQRLVEMHPDAIIMLSGNNDVHWALNGRDIRWFYSYSDENYITLLNEMYKSSGHPEWTNALPFSSRPVDCSDLARTTARNVEDAALFAGRVHARLFFALQPNIVSTTKRLTKHEQAIRGGQDKAYWDSCYQALRVELGRLGAPNYRLLDLSQLFGTLDDGTELFIDPYHFADAGQHLVAQALADQIDWSTVVPGAAVAADREPLTVIRFDQIEPGESGQAQEISAMRIVPSRINKNLQVVFDRSVLPTVVTDDGIIASIPASLMAKKRTHTVHVIDGVTGEASPPAMFESRNLETVSEHRRSARNLFSSLTGDALGWLRRRARGVFQSIDFRFGKRPKTKNKEQEPPNIYPLW
jgi:lysophospholipase L1-like esterase